MVDASRATLLAAALILAAHAIAQEGGGPESVAARLVAAAVRQTTQPVAYDGSYRRIPYPGGDVPAHVGVCTDLIVRAYRAVGVDLQVFFRRHGAELRVSDRASDYRTADLVTWMLPGNLPHIGLLTDRRSEQGRPLARGAERCQTRREDANR